MSFKKHYINLTLLLTEHFLEKLPINTQNGFIETYISLWQFINQPMSVNLFLCNSMSQQQWCQWLNSIKWMIWSNQTITRTPFTTFFLKKYFKRQIFLCVCLINLCYPAIKIALKNIQLDLLFVITLKNWLMSLLHQNYAHNLILCANTKNAETSTSKCLIMMGVFICQSLFNCTINRACICKINICTKTCTLGSALLQDTSKSQWNFPSKLKVT